MKAQTNSVNNDKVSPGITVSCIPAGCTLLSLDRLESDSSWSEALEGHGSFSQTLSLMPWAMTILYAISEKPDAHCTI